MTCIHSQIFNRKFFAETLPQKCFLQINLFLFSKTIKNVLYTLIEHFWSIRQRAVLGYIINANKPNNTKKGHWWLTFPRTLGVCGQREKMDNVQCSSGIQDMDSASWQSALITNHQQVPLPTELRGLVAVGEVQLWVAFISWPRVPAGSPGELIDGHRTSKNGGQLCKTLCVTLGSFDQVSKLKWTGFIPCSC